MVCFLCPGIRWGDSPPCNTLCYWCTTSILHNNKRFGLIETYRLFFSFVKPGLQYRPFSKVSQSLLSSVEKFAAVVKILQSTNASARGSPFRFLHAFALSQPSLKAFSMSNLTLFLSFGFNLSMNSSKNRFLEAGNALEICSFTALTSLSALTL